MKPHDLLLVKSYVFGLQLSHFQEMRLRQCLRHVQSLDRMSLEVALWLMLDIRRYIDNLLEYTIVMVILYLQLYHSYTIVVFIVIVCYSHTIVLDIVILQLYLVQLHNGLCQLLWNPEQIVNQLVTGGAHIVGKLFHQKRPLLESSNVWCGVVALAR